MSDEDVREARQELADWLEQMQAELHADGVDDPAAILRLKDMLAETFAVWRVETGWGVGRGES